MNRWRSSRLASFKNALSGILFNLKKEPNFLIQIVFAFLVLLAAILFPVTKNEWIVLLLAIGAVLSTEALNTSIEKICDRFLDKEDSMVKIIKDSSAAAVLIMSIAASTIGAVVFIPYIVDLFRKI